MSISMPRQAPKRTRAAGKSLPAGLPTQRGSRSRVICLGRPYLAKVSARASRAVSAVKSERTWASRSTEVPVSMILSVSTTCCRLLYGIPTSSGGESQHIVGQAADKRLRSLTACLQHREEQRGSENRGMRLPVALARQKRYTPEEKILFVFPKGVSVMLISYYATRANLLYLCQQHPHWSHAQLAAALGASHSWVEQILAIRDQPPEGLRRVPGPEAIHYYLERDPMLEFFQLSVPSCKTIYRILKAHDRIAERGQPLHQPRERPAPMTCWQLDFKDVSSVAADPEGKCMEYPHRQGGKATTSE